MPRHEAAKREALLNSDFQQLDRKSKQIDQKMTRNQQKMTHIEQIEAIFSDMNLKQKNQLEDLSANWKGAHARAVLSETASNYQMFQRHQQREIFETKRELSQRTGQLQKEQERLTQAKRNTIRGGK